MDDAIFSVFKISMSWHGEKDNEVVVSFFYSIIVFRRDENMNLPANLNIFLVSLLIIFKA